MGVGYIRHAPAALPLGMTRYPLYRRLCVREGIFLSLTHAPQLSPGVAADADFLCCKAAVLWRAIKETHSITKQVDGRLANVCYIRSSMRTNCTV
jgi:hypothetical protein